MRGNISSRMVYLCIKHASVCRKLLGNEGSQKSVEAPVSLVKDHFLGSANAQEYRISVANQASGSYALVTALEDGEK